MRKFSLAGLLILPLLCTAGCSMHRGSSNTSPKWLSHAPDGAVLASTHEPQDEFDCATSLMEQLAAGYR